MNIDVGVIKKYFLDKGFGFVSRTLTKGPDIFFHISSLKTSRNDLAEALANGGPPGQIHFWYEYERSAKGVGVCRVLQPHLIRDKDDDAMPSIISRVESIWLDNESATPRWLYDASVDLLGSERAAELRDERASLEGQKNNLKGNVLKPNANQESKEKEEFEKLVAEVGGKGFTKSNEVSRYIMQNRLGIKYPTISGKLTMEMNGREWGFNGGFPPKIYAKLCSSLGLGHQGSSARVVKFESFDDLI